MNRIALPGCNPEPLASYLKALAVLRLVAEQRDSEAKGSWEGEVFYLESVLDEEALVWFFLEDYAPTPVVAPWNHGSGFYEGDDTSGLDAISGRDARRFATYREAIKEIRTWSELPAQQRPLGEMLDAVMRAAASSDGKRKDKLQTLVWAVQRELDNAQRLVPGAASLPLAQIKASGAAKQLAALRRSAAKLRTEFKRLNQDKEAILFACRSRLGESALQWVDAAVSIGADNRPKYPQLLASGGNEGRLDYTNAFMRRLAEVLIAANPYRESLLRAALFGQPSAGLSVEATGQFDPGRAGGFNQGPGIENKDFPTNPWDFILAIEGSIAWAPSVVRRQGARLTFLASPFTVRAAAVGYSSSASEDGKQARAEIWTPLWERPAGYSELRSFLSEGRAEVGRRWATDSKGFAEAAASLAVDRGVSKFVRYSLLKRRGDSYIALPTGSFPVVYRREGDLVQAELDPILRSKPTALYAL